MDQFKRFCFCFKVEGGWAHSFCLRFGNPPPALAPPEFQKSDRQAMWQFYVRETNLFAVMTE
jgi:hypothetical protein